MPVKPPTEKAKPKLNIFIILVICAVAGFLLFSNNKPCTGLGCISFQGENSFKSVEIYELDNNSFRGMFADGQDKLRISVKSGIPKRNADEETSILITKMKKLFEKERSPYPGEISDTVACDDKFVPTWKLQNNLNGIEINYTTAFLNDRMVYGACTENQLSYEALFMAFYCPEQEKLYQLELINDKNSFLGNQERYMKILDSIRCN